MPPERGDYPYEVQVAFFIHDLLPDRWDGMSGSYMGKDYSALQVLLDTYEVEERKQVCLFVKHIEARHINQMNEKIKRKQKAKEQRAKAKGGINSANIK